MDMKFSPEPWLERRAETVDGGNRSRPDWHALRARLSAGYAAYNAIAGDDAHHAPAGSFESGCAATMARFETGLASVNPDALVNRKRADGKDTAAAGTPLSGSRG